MKVARSTLVLGGSLGVGLALVVSALARDARTVLSGDIARVWEDGFRLVKTDRAIRVDTWEVCGDDTARHLAAGDRVVVTGEFERGEFDAIAVTSLDGTPKCTRG
ncbi:MAG: hypothetical protein AAFX40_03650 [Cyanobacteria bacterium J06639_1]